MCEEDGTGLPEETAEAKYDAGACVNHQGRSSSPLGKSVHTQVEFHCTTVSLSAHSCVYALKSFLRPGGGAGVCGWLLLP